MPQFCSLFYAILQSWRPKEEDHDPMAPLNTPLQPLFKSGIFAASQKYAMKMYLKSWLIFVKSWVLTFKNNSTVHRMPKRFRRNSNPPGIIARFMHEPRCTQ